VAGALPVDGAHSYPCEFPLKVLGRREAGFAQSVVEIVRRHAPDFDPATVAMRPSRQGTYLALTCLVRTPSRAQLEALYRELCDHPTVVLVL